MLLINGHGFNVLYLHFISELVVVVLPAGLNYDPRAEDHSHHQDSVPKLLQVFLSNPDPGKKGFSHSGI